MEKAREAQSRLLQSQMSPHVLFNALNGFAELIHKDPAAAEGSVRSLAHLLRQLLTFAEFKVITLQEERALVEDYLHLEGLRLGSRLSSIWQWEERLQSRLVPPLLIQPLVENAIKHGIAPVKQGGILRISIREEAGSLLLEVANTGSSLGVKDGTRPGLGLGLRNLKDRLALAFGPDASFGLAEREGWTIATISLPGDKIAP
ncbi:MAG TPA: histidine kinase [Holophagaceae bacterium]|nr:histidine kinase [Holophagaceae bacterium]